MEDLLWGLMTLLKFTSISGASNLVVDDLIYSSLFYLVRGLFINAYKRLNKRKSGLNFAIGHFLDFLQYFSLIGGHII